MADCKKHACSVTFLVSLGDPHFSGGGYVTRVLQPISTSQQLHQAMSADGLARWPCVFICVAALFARCAQHWSVTTLRVAIQRHWPKKSDAEVTRRIDDCSDDAMDSDAATDALARLADPTDPTGAAAMCAAVVCAEAWRVVLWARLQAVRKGFVASTDLLLQQAAGLRAKFPRGHEPTATWAQGGQPWATARVSVTAAVGGRQGTLKVWGPSRCQICGTRPRIHPNALHQHACCVAPTHHLTCKCAAVGGPCRPMVNAMCLTVSRRM